MNNLPVFVEYVTIIGNRTTNHCMAGLEENRVFTLCAAPKNRLPAMERCSIMHYRDTDAESKQIWRFRIRLEDVWQISREGKREQMLRIINRQQSFYWDGNCHTFHSWKVQLYSPVQDEQNQCQESTSINLSCCSAGWQEPSTELQ